MKKSIALLIALMVTFALSACGQTVTEPEKPRASQNNDRVSARETTKASSIVPVLQFIAGEAKSEYRLESQSARFANDKKAEIVINLADNVSLTCEQELALPAEKHIIRIKIKNKKSEELKAQDLIQSSDHEITATLLQQSGETPLDKIEKMTISTINQSIIRGQIRVGNDAGFYEGEFFAAICR